MYVNVLTNWGKRSFRRKTLLSQIVRKLCQISSPSISSIYIFTPLFACPNKIIRICFVFLPGSWHLRKIREISFSSCRTTQRTWFYNAEYLHTSTSGLNARADIFFLFLSFFFIDAAATRYSTDSRLFRKRLFRNVFFNFHVLFICRPICEKSLVRYNGYRGPKTGWMAIFFSNAGWPPERKQMAWRISRSTGNYQLEGIPPRVIKRSDVAVPSGKATLRATLRLHTLSVLKPTGKTYRILLNMSDLRLRYPGNLIESDSIWRRFSVRSPFIDQIVSIFHGKRSQTSISKDKHLFVNSSIQINETIHLNGSCITRTRDDNCSRDKSRDREILFEFTYFV